MDALLLNSVYTLSGIAVVAAAILFMAAKKFKVFEDPKIDEVEDVLPSANCGACGFAGCRNFAEATVGASDLSQLSCPVGGNEVMQAVAAILGQAVEEMEPTTAVLKCHGTRTNAPAKVNYQGAESCKLAHMMFAGESGCAHGCVGLGDCVFVCDFDALVMDKESGLPEVNDDKCTSCGACVKACPRALFEIMPKGQNDKRVYVACMNTEKGAASKKNCKVACIGCSRCVKFGDGENISIKNFLSYINPKMDMEKFGPEVIGSCPTKAIIGIGVEGVKPAPKPKPLEKPLEKKEETTETKTEK